MHERIAESKQLYKPACFTILDLKRQCAYWQGTIRRRSDLTVFQSISICHLFDT